MTNTKHIMAIKRLMLICTVLLLLTQHGALAQTVKHVVIISIDGFRPDFYRDPSWGAVNLRRMATAGVSADGVNSIFPSLTFPNHTSIMTGVRSEHHGIFHNSPFSPKERPEWYWYEKDITAKTLWDAVEEKNGVTASVNWPVSVGAPVDYNIPIVKRRGFTQLEITSRYSVPEGLMDEVQKQATGRLDSISFNTNEDLFIMDENVGRITGYLIRQYKPALTTVRLSCVDHFEHLQGREGDKVVRAVANADGAVGHILESIQRAGIEDSTVIIVTGDHGFVDVHTSFSPNYLLKTAGLYDDNGSGTWRARFKPAGGSSFLYVNDPDDERTVDAIRELLQARPEFKENKFRIIDRHQLDNAGSDPAAAFALAGARGFSFVGSEKGPFAKHINRGTHGYYPDFAEIQTGFVAFGPSLRKGGVIPVMETVDVAALVAALLHLDMPDMQGKLHSEMFDE